MCKLLQDDIYGPQLTLIGYGWSLSIWLSLLKIPLYGNEPLRLLIIGVIKDHIIIMVIVRTPICDYKIQMYQENHEETIAAIARHWKQ